jgi:D-serine deaminase-like pyridoxal phosphate-dependent protein
MVGVSSHMHFCRLYTRLRLLRHAGNYCCLDLQQVATNLTRIENVAVSVLSRVISAYPHRNEALCDAGGIAMSKDTGPYPGYGKVVSPKEMADWKLGRVSQEHGILVRKPDAVQSDLPEPGQIIRICGQHACMILSNHPWYYVVEDGGDKVVDVWVPWKGW